MADFSLAVECRAGVESVMRVCATWMWVALTTCRGLDRWPCNLSDTDIHNFMIQSFRDAETERIFQQQPSKQFRSIEKTASVSSCI